ncbi:MAG: tRNA lysidine(34) synthetase TilS [Myxococcales bacterium]|nr:tRNA lysidine(34) synthetase TilS [Myxococcales bacterium]
MTGGLRGSHPPTLLTLARRALAGECGPVAGMSICVAVSGGRDSMALLQVLAKLAPQHGFTLSAHGIDHGLRAFAARELEGASLFAKSLGVPFRITRVDVERGGNLQARARDARHAALAAALPKGALLATAHHQDDRAETVLLRILRGASAEGLAVLPARDGMRLRPFIRAGREAIDAHVKRHAIPYFDDPSNDDPRFMRTRVRREVLPLLESLDAGIVGHLTGLADDMIAHRQENPSDDADESLPLPRATRDALAALVSRKSSRTRIALPGGLSARFDAATQSVRIEAARGRPARRKAAQPDGSRADSVGSGRRK